MGMNVVGQDVNSITDHIFYVLSTLVSDFEDALVNAGIEIDTVGTAVTAVTITSGNLDISAVVGGTAYQITYTTTPSGVTGAIFAINTTASTVAGTADWTKVAVSNTGEITLVTGHGLAAADKIAVDVIIDDYTVTKEITLVA
jgi:Na+/H+ antiporter NhaB